MEEEKEEEMEERERGEEDGREGTGETRPSTPFHILFEQDHLSQWLRLFRGTKAVIDSSAEDFHTGQLGPIFMNGAYLTAARREQRTLENGIMYVWELKQMIMREHSHDESLLSIYLPELDGLARSLAVSLKPGEGARLETADVFAWLLEASDEYLELLRHEAPVALIMFAYFCVAPASLLLSIRASGWRGLSMCAVPFT